MGLLRKLFEILSPPVVMPPARTYSGNDVTTIAQCAQRMVDIVNESLKIANESSNPETKLSRLGVAEQRLSDVKKYAKEYPFLTLTSLVDVEFSIAQLSHEFKAAGYQELVERNNTGKQLEEAKKIDEAISHYKLIIERWIDAPFPYKRLAILYRKRNKPDDELSTIRAALKNVPKSNSADHSWFKERLIKLGSV